MLPFQSSLVRSFEPLEILFLRCLVVCVFVGRAWQGIFFDIPLTELLWDEYWMSGTIQSLLGISWEQYVKTSHPTIQIIAMSFGYCWLCCAFAAGFVQRHTRWLKVILWIGSVTLLFLTVLMWKENFWSWGMLLEHALQVCAPLFLVFALSVNAQNNTPQFRLFLQLTIGITFFCHGLYAYGYYPKPATWIDWCMYVFYMNEPIARSFLTYIGIADFLILPLIFVPKAQKWAVIYCIVWGFMTALARIVSNLSSDMVLESFWRFTPEVLYRLVHGGIPLLLLWLWKPSKENTQ